MCGRYDLHDFGTLDDGFGLPEGFEGRPNYNVAPTHTMPVVSQDGPTMMRWGLIPVWSKDEKMGYKLFNTRSESAFEKPIWKAVMKNRCLIPANGFYEWEKREDGKQPFYIHAKDSDLMMFAGIWSKWKHDDKEWNTFSILTTTPNKEMSKLHDRMPVILHKDDYDQWLGADTREAAEELMKPLEDNSLEMYEVSRDVNVTKSTGEQLIAPLNSK